MAKRRKSRRRSLGGLGAAGKKWWKGKTGRYRTIASTVSVSRVGDTGERIIRPYRAEVCIGGSMSRSTALASRVPPKRGRPRRWERCGDARGKTPTKAIKAALAAAAKQFK